MADRRQPAYRRSVTYKPRDERLGYHHVCTRGNNKQTTFLTDENRLFFLQTLNRVAERHRWEILAYCLMRNHYHLVLRIREGGLARGMCELNTAYALGFNRSESRINHLFGKRYWNAYLHGEDRLRNALRYVVQNPRRAGAEGPLEAHVWTSYRATIGLALSVSRFARDELLALFAPEPVAAIARFRAFCEETPPTADGRWQPP